MAQMKMYFDEISASLPGFTGKFNALTGSVDGLTGSVYEAANAFLALAKAQVMADAYKIIMTDAAKDMALSQMKIEKMTTISHTQAMNHPVIKEHTEARKAFDSASAGWENAMGNVNGLLADMAPPVKTTSTGTGRTAANTSRMLDISEEELKYWKDLAEREAINQFTTAEIHIEQHNENHINSDLDVDGITKKLLDNVGAATLSVSEGNYV